MESIKSFLYKSLSNTEDKANSEHKLDDAYVRQATDFVALCQSIVNNESIHVRFEARYKNFNPSTNTATGPLDSIMVKIGGNLTVEEYQEIKQSIISSLKAQLGEENFTQLLQDAGSAKDGSFYLQLDPSKLVDIQLTPLADKINLSQERFSALKEQYIGVAKQYGIVKAGKPSSALIENMTLEECNRQLNSIVLLSNLDYFDKCHVAYQRDVYSVFPNRSPDNVNNELLGAKGSGVRNSGPHSSCVAPDGQVSMLIKTTFAEDNGEYVSPYILNVVAPALDVTNILPKTNNPEELKQTNPARPEFATYVNTSTYPPKFIQNNYTTAFFTLSKHILDAADIVQPKRVVLCAYGAGAFISSLEAIDRIGEQNGDYKTAYKDDALNSAADSFAILIAKLQDQKIEVVFTDFMHGSRAFWNKVNERLQKNGASVSQVADGGREGSIGQGWAKEGDLLINAWDPDSLLGNKGESDNTADGQYGRRTAMQFIHTIASQYYNNKQ